MESEAFVCWLLALEADDASRTETLWQLASDERLLEIRLRAMGAAGDTPEEDLMLWLARPNPRLRAACCQLVGQLRLHAYRQALVDLLADSDAEVKEQAILALAWLLPSIDIVNELHHALAAVIARRKAEFMARILNSCAE